MATRRILSGIRTTGPLHFGHYFGALRNWVNLQDEGYECFFLLADVQALTTHFENVSGIRDSVYEVVLDFLAVGLDPDRSTFFIQSQVPDLTELSMYFGMFTRVAELQQNPTIKEELKHQTDLLYGFLGYPVSQAADILLFSPVPLGSGDRLLVPVGEDQAPHIEGTRDIARRFNKLYGPTFVEPEILVGDVARLPGLDMDKMSKSRGNAIYLGDSADTVVAKIMSAYTDPNKQRVDDPGNPLGCAVYQYYSAFAPEIADEVIIACQRGEIGCVADKKRLIDVMNDFMEPIRSRRAEFAVNPDYVWEILARGNAHAREVGEAVMTVVRAAMKIDYPDLPTIELKPFRPRTW
ncbi:MAG: Tryptophan-tRNA ligase [Candidatus Nomurabacteria bacterium GW2011_GWA1_46_11]|uniref:Tryptophan--tRNA ligase n=2 Tax=Parcubacteria group TaxID=1794811 RepID=A0A1G1YWE4_9BACT|nr:MAG: Tryptophan-tRNA ligase [Parcubacteria group bacterium GW2011_GWA2_46_10]KKU22127.1 MAG: Tryptophan-tRNA ligase [Candidatus Nomurabacteria bacterium GW2011_GWA1_46_11]OGY56703.1 MAG: tryptophan--tRNA ligase [Candidatus Colwellbacteria bacterium GWA2_46_10]